MTERYYVFIKETYLLYLSYTKN